METKIFELLKTAVKGTNVPVIEEAYPNIFPCVTFHLYNESGALFGSGTATEEGASCQVDIWYKAKNDDVKSAIASTKQAIANERYFAYPSTETTYETNTKIYHTYINFDLIKESEE